MLEFLHSLLVVASCIVLTKDGFPCCSYLQDDGNIRSVSEIGLVSVVHDRSRVKSADFGLGTLQVGGTCEHGSGFHGLEYQ